MWYNTAPLMEMRQDGLEEARSGRPRRVPRAVACIDTAVAGLFTAAGIYHFTQPDRAWRSGAIEVTCAAALLVAAWLLGRRPAMAVQVLVAAGITALGIRHLVMGGGWKSGSMELVMAVVLVGAAVLIFRHRPEKA